MADDSYWLEPFDEPPYDDLDDGDDEGDDGSTDTIPCPVCGTEVYEDAVRCPACGDYITRQTGIWSGRPRWWILLGVLGILATIAALSGWLPW